VEVREKCQVNVPNGFAALKNLYNNRSCVGVRKILENLANFQLKRVCVSMNRSCINHGWIKNFEKFVYQRRQDKLQIL
jgi:hypothetical protein